MGKLDVRVYRPGVTEREAHLFRRVFVNRLRPVPIQQSDGTWRLWDRILDTGLVRRHLRGEITIGILLGKDGVTKTAALDLDVATADAMMEVWRRCDEVQIPVMTVFSGRKGFHVVVFFDGPTSAAKARAVMTLMAGDHEIWPKQDIIESGHLGNWLKAPFGVHRVTGNWCLPIDRNLETIDRPWRVVRDLTRVNADRVLADAFIARGRRRGYKGSPQAPSSLGMKPCLEQLERRGTEKGLRNRAGFALASELRRMGVSEGNTSAALSEWNQRNQPPLPAREVLSICRSAYRRDEPCAYGCSPNGALREFVECPGRSQCAHYQEYRRRHRSKDGESPNSLR